MVITLDTSYKSLTKYNNFDNFLLIVDDYFKITKLYGMENITTEEVMYKLDMFQEISGKVYEFCWWDMEIIQTEDGTQFIYKEFQEGVYVCGVRLALAAPDYQEMNGKVEVTWQTLRTIAHSIMVHTLVSEKYIHLELMYTTDNMFPLIPTKHLVNQDSEPTTSHKLATGTKPSVSNLHVLFC